MVYCIITSRGALNLLYYVLALWDDRIGKYIVGVQDRRRVIITRVLVTGKQKWPLTCRRCTKIVNVHNGREVQPIEPACHAQKLNRIDAQIPLLHVSTLLGSHHQGFLMLREAASPNWCNVTNTDAHQFHSEHRRTPVSLQTQTHTSSTPNTYAHEFHSRHIRARISLQKKYGHQFHSTHISTPISLHTHTHTNFTPETYAHQFHSTHTHTNFTPHTYARQFHSTHIRTPISLHTVSLRDEISECYKCKNTKTNRDIRNSIYAVLMGSQSSPEGQWTSRGPTRNANTDCATCVCSERIRCTRHDSVAPNIHTDCTNRCD
jgi:hypothetical protein